MQRQPFVRMGWLDRLLGRERFASQQWSASDPAFAAWWFGAADDQETVTPNTVLGISAVLRSVSVISTTIASLPLRTYERQGDGRSRVPSVFDDPWPGPDGMTPFAWAETVLIHLLLWRHAFLWHESIDSAGNVTAYRPVLPDLISKVERVNGKRQFTYRDADGEDKTVGSERITYIPGPSLDGIAGHPLLYGARAVFSAAISGDKTAQSVLRRGIRLGGIVTPADGEDDFDPAEGEHMLELLRAKVVGREHAGDVAILNRKLKLQNWTPNNIEAQWHETRGDVLGEVGRLFGMPPHLLNDIEKQTSWGTGVAEQNLGLARYTLMGWSTRLDQVLTRSLPNGSIAPRDGTEFVEFDYAGLLQGTPAQEIELLLKQTGNKAFLTVDEARRIRNLPPLTAAQKAELAGPAPVLPPPTPLPVRKEPAA